MSKPTLYDHTARQFYDGMTQAVREARSHFLPRVMVEFTKRGMEKIAEQAFGKNLPFRKRMHVTHSGVPSAPIAHGTSRFALEYFACISALNLYRLPSHVERFKAEQLSEKFFQLLEAEEGEWLGIYDADLPDFQKETGHVFGNWRRDLVRVYLTELKNKSSLDADTRIAVRRFLTRQELSKSAGVDVTPALLEHCADALESTAEWLEHYLKFHEI